MPVINRIAGFADEMAAWRRHIHAHPELGLDCHQTAAFVAERLRAFGVDELHEGIGRTGVVALVHGKGGSGPGEGPVTGLRADMDALPMSEETGAPHASTVPGRMHACGHDGHTTMLLGAAKYLTETRNFTGTVALIFQPAEEGDGGAKAMLDEGIMETFGIERVFGIHTSPYTDLGAFSTRPGPAMASADQFTIDITGLGAHASRPQTSRDPVAAALQIGQALNTIVARNTAATDQLVVSLTRITAGTTHNVIPQTAQMQGTVRAFSPQVQDMVEARMRDICAGMAQAMQVEVAVRYDRDIPPVINDSRMTEEAADTAREVMGADAVNDEAELILGGEDFAYMLQKRPGAFVFLGQGKGPALHNPAFDFNDAASPIGASYFARLIERLHAA